MPPIKKRKARTDRPKDIIKSQEAEIQAALAVKTQAEQEARATVVAREKRLGELLEQGVNPEVARLQVKREIREAPSEIPARREAELAEAERAKGLAFEEEVGAKEEKFPQPVELDVERKLPATLPVVGPAALAQEKVLRDVFGFPKEEHLKPLIENPETARELTLQAIQIKEQEKGTTGAEKFGVYVESIPIVGPLVSKYAGEMIETPSANVNTAVRNIKESRGRILKKYEATRANLMDPYLAYQNILGEEEEIYKLEQRIKNLADESPALIADADGLNVIEGKILRAKEVASFAKEAALTQIRGEPTDASIEAWLLSEIKTFEEEE